jgi:hypothetical protein
MEKACHTQRRDSPSFGRLYQVPKKDLVAALEVPFDRGTLKIAVGLELRPALREELQSFCRKQNTKTSNVSFEHWRDSNHDGLVLAVAIACWGRPADEAGGRFE